MSSIGRAYRAGVHTLGKPRHLHLRVYSSGTQVPGSDAAVPGPPGSGAGAGSPARTRALVALHTFMADPQHARWFGYAEKAGKPDVERFTQDSDVADWYGAIVDDKDVTYATYFDTRASTVEPAEEYAGTVVVKQDTPPPPTKASGPGAGLVLGLGLAAVGLIAVAKH